MVSNTSNHLSADLGEGPQFPKSRSPMESPIVERKQIGKFQQNTLDRKLLVQELPPPVSVMDSFSIEERNEKLLHDLQRETTQLDKLREAVSVTKQDLEISKFRVQDEINKGRQREPFTFKVPDEIISSTRQEYSPQKHTNGRLR
jgi:hypothetical protein